MKTTVLVRFLESVLAVSLMTVAGGVLSNSIAAAEVRSADGVHTAHVSPPGHGYWLVGSDGGVFTFGSAAFHGSTGALRLQRPVVSIAATRDEGGYWLVATDGGIFAFGDALFYGSIPGLGLAPAGSSGTGPKLNAPIVGMVPSTTGNGYFLVASDGGVFAFGDARFEGSCPGIGGCGSAPVVVVQPDATGNGYWVGTRSGSIFTFGDQPKSCYDPSAPPLGPSANTDYLTSGANTPDDGGCWELYASGSVTNAGDAKIYPGGPNVANPTSNRANAIVPTSTQGFWVFLANGTVETFGDAPNDGGMSGTNLNGSIIAGAGW